MLSHPTESLRALKVEVLKMGGLVERALEHATDALLDFHPEKFALVHAIELEINQLHRDLDEKCVQYLATYSPCASDLRLIVAAMKINTDLERMGDQAVNIARNASHYLKGEPLKPLVDLPRMSQLAREMVRRSLNSFVSANIDEARAVLDMDDSVDTLKNQIFSDVRDLMRFDPVLIDQGLNLILIARNLEKVGDHASNVAEDVIYAVSGVDVRHPKAALPAAALAAAKKDVQV